MTTFDELQSYEGKNILVLTNEDLIYTGRISNVRRPLRVERGFVAIAHFDYKHMYRTDDGKRFVTKAAIKSFGFIETDVVRDIEPYEIDFIQSPVTVT